MKLLHELIEELNSVLKGKTLDAILPPLVFVLVEARTTLFNAVILAIVFSLTLSVFRIMKRQSLIYAMGGLSAVLIAAVFALFANSASNYYLPGILSSSFIFLVTLVSILVDKPLAAFVSHLTRGWDISWFWRDDIKPAYREVTWLWATLIGLSTFIQWLLYFQGNVVRLAWITTLLGLPFTILILTTTYVYGLWRLKKLKGPGIDELVDKKEPPYRGQTRGF